MALCFPTDICVSVFASAACQALTRTKQSQVPALGEQTAITSNKDVVNQEINTAGRDKTAPGSEGVYSEEVSWRCDI